MKKLLVAVVGLACPMILGAAVWVNLDDEHHYSGPKLTEKDLEGKVVMVDNWGVRCPPCRASLPRIQEIWNSFKTKPFVMIGSHCQGRRPDEVKELVEANNLTYPMYERVGLAEGAPSFNAIPFIYVVNHRGRVVYSGHSDRDATEALVTAIADIGQPISLCQGVALPKRYKSFAKKLRLGSTIAGEIKKLEKEASGKNARMADEAKTILDAIEKTRLDVKAEIAAVKSRNPEEAAKMMQDYMKTWPKDGAEYKDELIELRKQIAASKAAAK